MTVELPFPARRVKRADDTVTVTTGHRPPGSHHRAHGRSRGHTHTAELA
ncbi:hypothetical protein [Streptomyces formicae]|nr:hypothetical protein [Streptomyces formicae]